MITRTATKRISWGAYKINHTQDRVGVFVSIVSTKIPFKGAGKVRCMIGPVHVRDRRRAMEECGAQARHHLPLLDQAGIQVHMFLQQLHTH